MAETAPVKQGVTAGKLASNVQKRLTRAQEKVLQKLGKADETRDAAFEEMVANFNKQTIEGTKLQRDMKAYLTAVKTMHDASRRLQDCLAEMYEPDWFGKEEMDTMMEELLEKEMDNNLEDTDTQWLDYHQNITDKSLVTMDTYLAQFPDIKARIAKRDRKMVDFDSARHHFASLQKGKKKDEAKIAKQTALLEMAAPSWAQGLISAHQVAQTNLSHNQAEEELGRAQKIFEELNVELQDELPSLYENRVGIYVNSFQSLAGNQEKFHKEMSKLSQNLNDIMTKLDEQRQIKKHGTAAEKTGEEAKSEEANHSEAASAAPSAAPPKQCEPSSGLNLLDWDVEVLQPVTFTAPEQAEQEPPTQDADQCPAEAPVDWSYDESKTHSSTQPGWDEAEPNDGGVCAAQSFTEPNWDDQGAQTGQDSDWGDAAEAQSAAVTNGSDGDMPPGFLYKVKAIHDYSATDGDELELKMGDMVLVMAFDTPDEQDDGWLMGVKEPHWLQKKDISIKGVFPENFTEKV